MTPYQIMAKAREMGVLPEAALTMRIRFLRDRVDFYRTIDDGDTLLVAVWAAQDIIEVVELEKYLRREKQIRESEITDTMIEIARSVPIDTIVKFTRGLAHCINPDHADKNPSMFHGTRTNNAICPACGEKYDSIAAYQLLHGCDFKAAVRAMQN